ncbi:hypothetical protein PROP_00396 [Propionicimonas sp. T2.31MG-18]
MQKVSGAIEPGQDPVRVTWPSPWHPIRRLGDPVGQGTFTAALVLAMVA